MGWDPTRDESLDIKILQLLDVRIPAIKAVLESCKEAPTCSAAPPYGIWSRAHITLLLEQVVDFEFPDKVVVSYFELREDGAADSPAGNAHADGRVVSAEEVRHLRPLPPQEEEGARSAWLGSVSPGSPLDLKFDGGWWEVELVSASPPLYRVFSGRYMAEHEVSQEVLRPPHVWEGGAWSLRPARGDVAESESSRSKRRKRDTRRQTGEPKDKPSNFAVGTRRRGEDGSLWEVRMTETLSEIWVPVAPKAVVQTSVCSTEGKESIHVEEKSEEDEPCELVDLDMAQAPRALP